MKCPFRWNKKIIERTLPDGIKVIEENTEYAECHDKECKLYDKFSSYENRKCRRIENDYK